MRGACIKPTVTGGDPHLQSLFQILVIEIPRLEKRIDKEPPSIKFYNKVRAEHSKMGREQMLPLSKNKTVASSPEMREMARQGLAPNEISYSAANSTCEKGQQWEMVLEVMREVVLSGCLFV